MWNIALLVLSTILKDFFTSFIVESKILRNRQVGWQGRVQNNRDLPHDVQSPDCRVLTQTYSPIFFSSRFWRVGKQWFLSLIIQKNWQHVFSPRTRIFFQPKQKSDFYLGPAKSVFICQILPIFSKYSLDVDLYKFNCTQLHFLNLTPAFTCITSKTQI